MSNTPIYYQEWRHVSTLQGHHQAFIMNHYIKKNCVHSWDPNECLQIQNRFVSSDHLYCGMKLLG